VPLESDVSSPAGPVSRSRVAAFFLGRIGLGIVVLGAGIAGTAGRADEAAAGAGGPLRTWDGRHSIATIAATIVYFVPADRVPIADWAERIGWFARRIEAFHAREFGDASRLKVVVHPRPVVSSSPTRLLREGDANRIFDRTMREAEAAVGFAAAREAAGGFPVLVVLSDVNWRPLDDFSRQTPTRDGWRFDGSLATDGTHVPGARAGGSRAVYLGDEGKGWGLVSADGWRVPMRGSDCVVYHEGVGHAIGLPHPDPLDGSVMGLGQYRGWLGESWIDDAQKRRLGWQGPGRAAEPRRDLFTTFRALPDPVQPHPGEEVSLVLEMPNDVPIGDARVEIQTSMRGPWTRIPVTSRSLSDGRVTIGSFDRPCGVAYRAVVEGRAGGMRRDTAEVWGFFQVRGPADEPPPPEDVHPTDRDVATEGAATGSRADGVELLPLLDAHRAVAGTWRTESAVEAEPPTLLAPKAFGARIEIPYRPPAAYRLTVVATPLDEPNGLVLGQRSAAGRFVVLLDFRLGDGRVSALENVDGRNVQANPTRIDGPVFRRGCPAVVVCTVRGDGVEVEVDGRTLIDWRGDPARLSLAEYWTTPTADALFLGAYDCRYRFHRVTLEPLEAHGADDDGSGPP